ncbi:MAG: hypothetical protein SFU86_20295 [Pirellulaceae bacterium]|nr:hypothetical protein [Pirellulaceae bacterium]
MSLDFHTVCGYFAPPVPTYWKWEEEGTVLAWYDGPTICYRDELAAVLRRLAPAGLPPLGSVLLLLAALRDRWGEPPAREVVLHQYLGLHLVGGGPYRELLTEVLLGLQQVGRCRRLVTTPAAKAEVAALVFEDAPGRYLPSLSRALLERLAGGLTADEIDLRQAAGLEELLHDLGCLRWGLPRVTPETLALRLKAGIDELPSEAPIKPPPAGTARELIAKLEDDPELGSVARLAKLLLAAVHLPRALSDPEELPIGGVSDVANRGPLDRLLLSELAHDDLTLAVRVAMNEALYLRRESPPRTPPRQRKVLLDAGLRTWGVPRVFVAAVGLALAAKSDPQLAVRAFRSASGHATPVDFSTREGLAAHLAALDPGLHPGAALAALVAEEQTPDGETDLVLVTTPDTLADPAFARDLQAAAIPPLFLASVSREGRFELIHRTPRGRKTICIAKLDLADILKPTAQRAASLIDKAKTEQLPAIFTFPRFPLRLSVPFDWQRSWQTSPRDIFTLTRDGRLLHWAGHGQGAEQLIEGLPAGDLLFAPSRADGRQLPIVFGKRSQRGLRALHLDLETRAHSLVNLQLDADQPREVLGQGGVLYVYFTDRLNIVSPTTGELLATKRLDPAAERRGRFTARRQANGQTVWYLARYSPDAREVIELEICRETSEFKLLGMFDIPGIEGPRGLTTKLELLDPVSRVARPLTVRERPGEWAVVPPIYLGAASRDGQRVMLTAGVHSLPAKSLNRQYLLIDLGAGTLAIAHHGAVSPEPREIPVNPRTLHGKFVSVGITKRLQLALRSRRSSWWVIEASLPDGTLRFPTKGGQSLAEAELLVRAEFTPLDDLDRGYTLSLATFPDGSRAWMDSRGLLHLKSVDPTVPECSLVLCEGPLAGWMGGEGLFGPEYWRLGMEGTGANHVNLHAIAPFIQRVLA